MKIVIDTNLLIDAQADDYSFGNRIIDEVINGKLAAFANRQTLSENRTMARRKITDEEYLIKLEQFFDKINLVENKKLIRIVEDYDDNKILESAVESQSEYLITSDNHLLKLIEYDKIKIVTPQQFWRIYEDELSFGWQQWLKDFIR